MLTKNIKYQYLPTVFDVVGRLVALVVVAALCLLFGSFCCISFCAHRLKLQIEGKRLQKILFRIEK